MCFELKNGSKITLFKVRVLTSDINKAYGIGQKIKE